MFNRPLPPSPMPYTCGVCGYPRIMGEMHTCRTLPPPPPIKGICASCGSSIPVGSEGDVHTSAYPMYGIPAHHMSLCAACASNVANVVIGIRAMKMNPTPELLAEFRRSPFRELLPMNLFANVARRTTYHMKELLMLKPMGPRVLVKRVDAPKPTSSTIIIPETVDGETSHYAVVLAVGNKLAEDIKVADTVILAAYCGSPVQVELEGEILDAIVVMESDILAVVEEA